MYAVVRTGGKQYRVEPGQLVRVEKLPGAVGDAVALEVLAVGDGGDVKTGAPLLSGATVKATIQEHGRGKKIRVYKYKRRKGYKRTQGHRQDYTALKIAEIVAG